MFLRGNDILNIQQFNLSALPMPADAYSEPFYISKMKLLSKRDCFMFDRVLNKRLTSKESSSLFTLIIVSFSYFLISFPEILRAIFYKIQ